MEIKIGNVALTNALNFKYATQHTKYLGTIENENRGKIQENRTKGETQI